MTLLIALIMLVLITLLVVVSSGTVTSNLKIVNNIEARAFAESAALSAIEEMIDVNSIELGYAFGGSNIMYFDATGDGEAGAELKVEALNLQCVTVRPVPNALLNILNTEDQKCYRPGAMSRCVDVLWEVDIVVTDPVTEAEVTIRQGLEKRDDQNNISTAC